MSGEMDIPPPAPGVVLSEADLITGSVDLWAEWLRAAILSFSQRAASAREGSVFAPLDIDAASQSLAGDIAHQMRQLMEASPAAERAAVEVLSRWSPSYDGWEGAALLIQIASELGGGAMLAPAINRLLGMAETLPTQARGELAFLAMDAASQRFRRSEVVRLAEQLWQLDLLVPYLAADLAIILAGSDVAGLRELPVELIHVLPNITDEMSQPEYVEAIGDRLRVTFAPEQLIVALAPDDTDDDDLAEFRSALAARIVQIDPAPPATSDTTREMNERTRGIRESEEVITFYLFDPDEDRAR